MQQNLKGSWVLITGASSGFGAATALAFAAQGARLILGARRQDRLAEVAQKAYSSGSPEVLYEFLDVTDSESVGRFIEHVKKHTAQVHVLINNAGGALGLDPIVSADERDWEIMFKTNVLGLLRMCKAVLPLMIPYKSGTIINVGSIAGHTAYEGGSAYCGAKAAVRQITKVLRLELCGTGIRVGVIDPGFAKTEFSLVRFKGDLEKAEKVYEGMEPLSAEDVAEAIVWMVTRPPHVCIDELVIKPTDQAEIYKIHRRKSPSGD